MAVWVLTGFMGCGKSSIGRAAESLRPSEAHHHASATFVDLPEDSGFFAAGRKMDGNLPEDTDFNTAGRKTGDNLPAHLTFIDLDEEIVQRCGRSIPEIFAAEGEEGFRAIEHNTLETLLTAVDSTPEGRNTCGSIAGGPSRRDGVVSPKGELPQGYYPQRELLIALGGGTLMSEECRELVKKNAKCIYLRAKVETLAENLRADDVAVRPMLAGVDLTAPAESTDSLESRIATMMAERGPIYEKAADIILDIDGLTYEDAALQILNSFSR